MTNRPELVGVGRGSSRAPLPTAAVRPEVADLLAAAVYRWVK